MVRITEAELVRKIGRAERGRRMPYLSAVCESMGWPIISEGVTEYTKGLRTNCYTIKDERYTTSLAMSKELNMLAIGSAYKQTAGGYNLYFVRDTLESKALSTMGPRFEHTQVEKMDIPIHALDWTGSHLLVGSRNGITQLYAVRHDDTTENMLRLILIAEYTAPPKQLSMVGQYVPSNYPINSIIHSASFAPLYSPEYVYEQWQPMSQFGTHATESSGNASTCFLSSFGNHINIWDALSEQEPALSYKVDETPMNVANWSPHASQTLIVTGGCDKALKVIDTRVPPSAAIVWRAENAHSRPIRDAQFNPFIPYWIGTAGEDCLAQVFDLRSTYHAPVARIAGQESIVRSLSWSNMRPENFMTTSNDGTMRMWMLTRDSVSVADAHARTAKWSKKDTPPSSIRPDQKALWQRWLNSSIPAPWSEYNKHQYYGDEDDPWGNSLYGEPDTMMVPSAIGIGEWGRQENLPVFVGEDIETANGAVCRVMASKTKISGYYGITDRGQVLAQTIRLEDHENLKFKFKFDKKTDPIARQLEYDIYVRHIEDARQELEKLKQVELHDPDRARERHTQVDYFEDCMQVLPPIPKESWAMDSIPSEAECKRRLWTDEDRWELAVSIFQRDLEYWTYRLPPGYETLNGFPLDAKDMTANTAAEIERPLSLTPEYSDNNADSTPLSTSPSAQNASPVIGDDQSLSPKPSHESLRSPSHTPSFKSLASSLRSTPTSPTISSPSAHSNPNLETSTAPHQRHGLQRLATRSKTLRRMFTKRSGSKSSPTSATAEQQPPPPLPAKSEQEENEVVPDPPRRQRTIRRNALFGPS